MSNWLELVPSDTALRNQLRELLDRSGVSYTLEESHTIVIESPAIGDVEDLLRSEVYGAMFGPYYELTCDDDQSEEETREYMRSHGISFVEHIREDDFAFVISKSDDPDAWD